MSVQSLLPRQLRRLAMNLNPTMLKFQPPVNRNMRTLDRSFFITKVPLCVVSFPDPRNISLFSKQFKDCILRVPRIPHVAKLETLPGQDNTSNNDNDTVKKGVLLHDSITKVDECYQKLPKEALEFLKNANAEILPYEKVLEYDFWKTDEILRAVLPEDLLHDIPTGFTVTGHIAHLNLREEFKPYDTFIGQVILDKNGRIETVVDKVSSIATKFRTFPMKVIAGRDDSLVVEQRESDCIFKFDFSKVYWNSRLHTEHDRLVSQFFQPGQIVCDVFAGVGPFAIPAGKKKVLVLANDLNPDSFKYLQENIQLNKVAHTVKPFEMDGAQFIRESPRLVEQWSKSDGGKILIPLNNNNRRKRQKKDDQKTLEPPAQHEREIPIPQEINHYVMNLPDSAITFLHHFRGLLKGTNIKNMPWIHVHCFEKHSNDEEPAMEELHKRVYQRIIDELQTDESTLAITQVKFHLVRKVSPTKPMFCASFQLPTDVAYAEQ
ncbi:hypothetical protein ZYGR_0I06080 [Zygosaccharomyces rouxii]|uniref:tRNA (guanine(37)-N1)-methyltransferase n=2 Tax=Zygosaccharomyces rouxii TaxID=4956 RepID=C5DU73_ZYGRC|nr:uncharacterized protein ZYRO0C14432g [Zygosaccharomyces rouxii]KAH9201491.1 Met-10+ like-protein-domain-containing protein [Zygosaccharomyces rouxii]GAV48311.1 hypothetical protein ZYGR_0I06080 [Zygosaccharomyces rouxii]CAR27334.1 ZYRO0C14432p [Zygosaccharomyces rouxii]